jgi:predicted nucleotidyltransferase
VFDAASFGELRTHRELLEQAVIRLRSDKRVVGLILGGSLATGGWDFYSDVDLYVLVANGVLEEVFAARESTADAVGSRLCGFAVEPVAGGSTDYCVLYEGPAGPVKFDFMYLQLSDLRPDLKWVGCLVLDDATSGRITDVLGESRALDLPPLLPEDLVELDREFWTRCWYTFGKIMRGELWEALAAVHTLRGDTLLPLLDWNAGRRPEGYRRLERKEDEGTLALLGTTVVPRPLPEELHAALRKEMDLFCELGTALAKRLGIALHPQHGSAVRSAIERHWAERKA